jgi:quercetin dioxygenase-like cupin family protein
MRTHFAALISLVLLGGAAYAATADEIRLTPEEIGAKSMEGAGAGTSGVAGIHTTVLQGDPSKRGIYTIRLSIPANMTIAAHTHRDNRAAVVMSGTWYFGYGSKNEAARTKPLKAGSFYTEPAGVAHFAITKAEPVVVYITGFGPTDTVYVVAKNDPRGK